MNRGEKNMKKILIFLVALVSLFCVFSAFATDSPWPWAFRVDNQTSGDFTITYTDKAASVSCTFPANSTTTQMLTNAPHYQINVYYEWGGYTSSSQFISQHNNDWPSDDDIWVNAFTGVEYNYTQSGGPSFGSVDGTEARIVDLTITPITPPTP